MGKLSCGCCCLFFVLLAGCIAALAVLVLGVWLFFSPETRDSGLNDAQGSWGTVKQQVDELFVILRLKEKEIPPPPTPATVIPKVLEQIPMPQLPTMTLSPSPGTSSLREIEKTQLQTMPEPLAAPPKENITSK